MVPAVQNLKGHTLDSIISQAGGKSIYGPGILAILSSIGWSIAGNPATANKLIINPNGDAFVSSDGVSQRAFTAWFMILVLAVCSI